MSINPVQGIDPASEEQLAYANPRLGQSRPVPVSRSTQPDSGTPPKQEFRAPQRPPASVEMPQDEVQVQRDSEANEEIVIKYMDRSGDVILQVPSSQVLGLVHAIHEDFLQQAKARASADMTSAAGDGGRTHGH